MNQSELLQWIKQNGEVSFSRSGGPGGQYVNTSDTRVSLRIPVRQLPVTEAQLFKILKALDNRITSGEELLIHSSETRSQGKNREIAEERACKLILSALKPRKKRRPTRPSPAAKERRLREKKVRSEKKRRRRFFPGKRET